MKIKLFSLNIFACPELGKTHMKDHCLEGATFWAKGLKSVS